MRYPVEVRTLCQDPKYPRAKTMLDDILNRRLQPAIVREFFPGSESKIIAGQSIYHLPDLSTHMPRKNRPHAPETLAHVRERMAADPKLSLIDTALTTIDNYVCPLIDLPEDIREARFSTLDASVDDIGKNVGVEMHLVFGKYTEKISKIFGAAVYYNLKRKCNINSAAHWARIAGLMYGLRALGIVNGRAPEFYAAVGASHDAPEDLPSIANRGNHGTYGIKHAAEFEMDFIHPDILPHVITDTNTYDAVMSDVVRRLKSDDKPLNINNARMMLKKMKGSTYSGVQGEVMILRNIVERTADDKRFSRLTSSQLQEHIEWLAYEDYVSKIFNRCQGMGDYVAAICKFCDWYDNLRGIGALDENKRVQNLSKINFGASELYGRGLTIKYLDNFVEELLENALVYAQHLVIKDFLQRGSQPDFFHSAMHRIVALKDLFYERRTA